MLACSFGSHPTLALGLLLVTEAIFAGEAEREEMRAGGASVARACSSELRPDAAAASALALQGAKEREIHTIHTVARNPPYFMMSDFLPPEELGPQNALILDEPTSG